MLIQMVRSWHGSWIPTACSQAILFRVLLPVKPIEIGGSVGRVEATGRGVTIIAYQCMEKNHVDPAHAAIAVQGMGNVGGTAAEIFYKNGQKVVAVSDYTGGLYCEDGLDIPAIRKFISEGILLINTRQRAFPTLQMTALSPANVMF